MARSCGFASMSNANLKRWFFPIRKIRAVAMACGRRPVSKPFLGEGSYVEFNFSPSSQWAAYRFERYREGMVELELTSPPEIHLDASEGHFALEATVPNAGLAGNLALSAVIEETDGTKSYWALAHPPGKPDFHHPACFALTLPPPETP